MKCQMKFSVFLLFLLVLRNWGLRCGQWEYSLDRLKCCHFCAPGTEMQARCTKTSATLCQQCEEGTYNSEYSIWDCKPCTICNSVNGLQQVKKCDSKSDTVCVCVPGHEPATSGSDEKRCNPCPEGYFSKGGDSICTPWTNCTAMGISVLRAGSMEKDAICDKAPTPITKFPKKHSLEREMVHATSVTKPTSRSTSTALTALPTEGPPDGIKSSEYLLNILIAAALFLGLGLILSLKIFQKTKGPQTFMEQMYKGPTSKEHNETDGKSSFRIPIQEEQIYAKSSLVQN